MVTATSETYTLSYTTLFRSPDGRSRGGSSFAERHDGGIGLCFFRPISEGLRFGEKRIHLGLGDPGLTASIHFRSEEHTSELQSLRHLVCRLLLEKKKNDKL